jgi:tRNA U34 2-thiouridine synthase MnmA/TrmU
VAEKVAAKLGIEFRVETMGKDYLEIVKRPKYGHGTGMNPCIDCKIYMLKRAKKIAENEGAEFVVTGEVLGQRPMSQHSIALKILERDSGLQGRLLRPLSAKYLPETIAEKEGLVDRNKLLGIKGRGRKEQLALAKEKGIDMYIPAAGGCILTDEFFTKKMKDILEHNENVDWDDIVILNIGRHFRFDKSKIIVGRNEKENIALGEMRKPGDYMFELPEEIPGPLTLLQEEKSAKAIELAAALTLRYSDLKQDTAVVTYGEKDKSRSIEVHLSVVDETDFFNVSSGTKE